MAEKSYYDILGIPSTATPAEIKSAYRKLALRWHPDKNPDNKTTAEKMFQTISEAYEVLSDEEARAKYDRYGKRGLQGGVEPPRPSGGTRAHSAHAHANPFHFHDPRDVFKDFFGTSDPFADFHTNFSDVKEEVFAEKPGGAHSQAPPPHRGIHGSIHGSAARSMPTVFNHRDPFADLHRQHFAGDPFGMDSMMGMSMGMGMGVGRGAPHMGRSTSSYTMSYTSTSTGPGGVKISSSQTVAQGGKTVTKTLHSDGQYTQAIMEETVDGTTRRVTGTREGSIAIAGTAPRSAPVQNLPSTIRK